MESGKVCLPIRGRDLSAPVCDFVGDLLYGLKARGAWSLSSRGDSLAGMGVRGSRKPDIWVLFYFGYRLWRVSSGPYAVHFSGDKSHVVLHRLYARRRRGSEQG